MSGKPFTPGSDARRKPLSPEAQAKGRETQARNRTIKRVLAAHLEANEGEALDRMCQAQIELAQGILVEKETEDGPTVYSRAPDTNAFKAVADRYEGAVAQKIEIANPDVFAAFARHMTAHGVPEETCLAIVTAVCAEIDPDGDDPAG